MSAVFALLAALASAVAIYVLIEAMADQWGDFISTVSTRATPNSPRGGGRCPDRKGPAAAFSLLSHTQGVAQP